MKELKIRRNSFWACLYRLSRGFWGTYGIWVKNEEVADPKTSCTMVRWILLSPLTFLAGLIPLYLGGLILTLIVAVVGVGGAFFNKTLRVGGEGLSQDIPWKIEIGNHVILIVPSVLWLGVMVFLVGWTPVTSWIASASMELTALVYSAAVWQLGPFPFIVVLVVTAVLAVSVMKTIRAVQNPETFLGASYRAFREKHCRKVVFFD